MSQEQPRLTPNFTRQELVLWTQAKNLTRIEDVLPSFLMMFRSIHTQKSYLGDLKDFLSFLSHMNFPIADVREITEDHLFLWHEFLNNRKNVAQTTVKRKLDALASLFSFCCQKKLIQKNPMRFLKRPRIKPQSKTNAFSAEEVADILSYLRCACHDFSFSDGFSGTAPLYLRSAGLRYAVLSTLFYVGMRIEELCALKIGDIERNDSWTRLHLTTKGGRRHSPIVNENLAVILQKYIVTMRPMAASDDFLFVRVQRVKRPTKLTRVAVARMLVQSAREVGIQKNVSPHSCRATLATVLHKQGVPVGQIQDLLNHRQVTTTMIYVKKGDELAEAAATKIDF